jgi:hypothetical protein
MMKSSREIVIKSDRAFRQKNDGRSKIASVVNPCNFRAGKTPNAEIARRCSLPKVLVEIWGTQETRKLDGRTKLDSISAITRNDWPHFAPQFPCVSVDNTRPLCGQVN